MLHTGDAVNAGGPVSVLHADVSTLCAHFDTWREQRSLDADLELFHYWAKACGVVRPFAPATTSGEFLGWADLMDSDDDE